MSAIATEAVDPSRESTDRRARLIAAGCATGALLVAGTAISGYASGDLRLASFAEDGIVMRPNAIVSVLTSSGAVLLLFFGGTAMRRLAMLLASFVLLLAFLTLCEYLFHVSLGIDNLLFPAMIEGALQGVRMPHLAAIKFLLLGCALLLLASGGARSAWAAQTLGAVVSFIAMLSALGFTFGVEAFYSGGFHTDVSLPTTIACFLLSCAVMMLRANAGWTKVMFSPAAGGIMLRRMLPLAVLVPWVLAWLSLAGTRLSYYTQEVDQVFFAGPLIVIMVLVLLRNARLLDRVDKERALQSEHIRELNRDLEKRVVLRTTELASANAALQMEIGEHHRTERQLHDIEQELRDKHLYTRSLIESSIDALATIGPDGRIKDVNQQMEALTGYPRQKLIGTPFRQHFSDPEHAEAGLRLVLETGKLTDYELLVRHRNGTRTPVAYNASTFYNQQRELQGVFAAARDITDRKKLEQELREKHLYTRSLIESSIDALATISPDGRITDVNQQMEELTGHSRRELIGAAFRECFTDPERAEAGIRLVLETGKVTDYELIARRRNGRPTPVAYNAATFYNQQHELQGVFAAARDISERKRAEESLRLQAEQYATMLATSVDGFWRFDLHGNLLDVNDTYCRMSGYTRDELLAMSIQQIEVLETPEQVAGHIRQVVQSGFDRFESQHRRKDGTVLDVEISVSFWRSSQQMILFVRDITDRKRAQQALRRSEERYRSLTIATAQIVWLTDRDGQVAGGLPSWTAYTGMSTENVQGCGWLNAIHPEDRERTGEAWAKAVREHKPYQIEYRIRRQDGQYRHMVARGVPVVGPDGSICEWIGTCTDVTEQKLAEQELARAHAELEDKVRERTADLAAANQELEAFTYSVSHDLRAPLRHVGSFAELLSQHLGSGVDEQTAHYLTRIRNGAERMSRLVEDLLNLSRIGRQELRRETTPLTAIVEAVIRELETGDRQIEWKLGSLPNAMCDAALIKQVFFNLLANAVKFSAPRERAVIEIGQLAYDPSTIYVRDNGVGFDMKYADKLFGAFQRLHPPEQFPGSGIGLATVRRIVAKHGGKVWAEAALDAGATFYFTLGPSMLEPSRTLETECVLMK